MKVSNSIIINLLGLWNNQEYHDKRYNVEACVEAESSSRPKTI
jgi:hypothetical protein